MKIIVELKSSYGKTWVYPVCAKAKLFTELTGARTFTHQHIAIIKQLGYEIELQNPLLENSNIREF